MTRSEVQSCASLADLRDDRDMSELLAQVIPLAFGAAISPLLLIVQVFVLSGGHKPIVRASAVTVGAFASLAVFTLLLVLFFHGTTAATGGKSVSSAWVHFGAAFLLALLGVRNLRNRQVDSKNASRAQKMARARSLDFLAIGVVVMILNVTTLVLFAPAVHDIVSSTVSTTDRVIAYTLLVVISLLPLLIPLIATVAMGSNSVAFLAKLNEFVTKHNAVINACVCFGFAAYLLFSGLRVL